MSCLALDFTVIDALHYFHGHGMNASDLENRYHDANDHHVWFAANCTHPNNFGHNELRWLFFEAIDWDCVATP